MTVRRPSQVRETPVKASRAVTLIELLVAISISGIVLLAVSGIFLGIQRQWAYSATRGKAVEAAEIALDQIATDIRNAIALQAVDGTKTFTFSLPANMDAQGNYVPARVGPSIQYVAGSRIHYYLSDSTGAAGTGTMLWRETNSLPSGNSGWTADSAWSLAAGSGSKTKYNNVSALTFTTAGLPTNVVQVSVTVQVTEGQQTYTLTLQRSVYLSNHN